MLSRRLVLSFPGQAAGSLVYFNGTDWIPLGVGATGYVLTVVAGVPSWAPASGGGPVRREVTLATHEVVDGSEGAVWKTVGSRRIDPATYPSSTWAFVAEGIAAGTTGKVRLYDATADANVAELTMSATGPTDAGAMQSAAVAIPITTTQYLVQIRVPATGSPSDSFTLTTAYLAVTAS